MATKTIGSSGRDYATLALWASYVNALALSAPEIGQCFNDSEFTFTSAVTLGGWTGGSGTNTVTLTCGTGQSFRDNASVQSNALRYNQSNGVGISGNIDYGTSISVTGDHFIMDGLQVKNASGHPQGALVVTALATTLSCTIQNSIFQGSMRSNGNFVVDIARSVTLQNCLILSTGTSGSGLRGTRADNISSVAIDLTVVSSNSSGGTGITSQYTPGMATTNCAVAGFTTDYSGTADAASTNNATDKGSFGGTNFGGSGQASIVGATEWQSVTNGSEDYRVKSSTSVKLKGNGATSGPSSDIVGTTRSAPYTIGAWQVGATAVTITPSVGSLAITGTTPVITKSASSFIQPSVGSLAIAGQNPSVTTGANVSIQPSARALAITGATPVITVSASYFIQPSAGALTFTGSAPTIDTGATQLGLSIGDSLVCYTDLTHVRAQMGQSGLDSILYTAP